jgi:polysaccharide chain length determinant protein (PEP-CTERM system associated)
MHQDLFARIRAELRRLWLRRWLGVAVAWAVALIGAVFVALSSNRYEANARIFVDTQTVLKPLMAGLAFQPDLDQQVRMLARTLISRPNVERLMKSPEVGLEPPPPEQYDRALDRLKDKIKFAPSGANLYAISFRDSDPQRAKRVVETLVEMFVDSNVDTKKRDSGEASRFIDTQIKDYEGKLLEAENKLKDFKIRNFGTSGQSDQSFFARMSAQADEVNKLRLELMSAEQSRDALRRELAREDPQLPIQSMPGLARPHQPTELEGRLEAQRKQLDELLRRFTEQHPDVVSARRTIAALEQQRREEVEATKAANAAVGGAAATNPVYQQLRVSLASAEASVASLRTRLGGQQARLQELRATASRIPVVEAELAQLNRDYDIIRKNYEQLVSRRESAALGVKIDQSSPMAEFRVVEPPQVVPGAVFPSRAMLAALVVLFALSCGVAAMFAASHFMPTFDDVKALREFSGRPVLGAITSLVTDLSRKRLRLEGAAFAGAMGLFLITNSAWVLWVRAASRL